MTSDKTIKVEFAPGCFDQFEGTQEELDELIKEIQGMFEGKTKEEIEALGGRPVDPDDLPPEVLAQIAENFFDEEELLELEKMGMPRNRKLQ
jgi:hypothetical protein